MVGFYRLGEESGSRLGAYAHIDSAWCGQFIRTGCIRLGVRVITGKKPQANSQSESRRLVNPDPGFAERTNQPTRTAAVTIQNIQGFRFSAAFTFSEFLGIVQAAASTIYETT